MSEQRPPLIQRLIRLGFILALAVLLLIWPAVLLVDHFAGKEIITLGSMNPDGLIVLNQASFDPELDVDQTLPPAKKKRELQEQIAAIYGTSTVPPTRYVFISDDELIRPKEDPSLSLMVKASGEYRLQAQTLYWFAKMTTYGAGGAALLCFALLQLLRHRRRSPERAPMQAA